MPRYTVFEVAKPAQQFYCVERSGFIDVNEAMKSAIDDMIQFGSFTVANVVYTDSQGLPAFSAWPPLERFYTLSNPGAGYKVGNDLYMVGGTQSSSANPKFKMTVDSINATGGILTFTISQTGSYTSIPGPASNVALAYESETTTVNSSSSVVVSSASNSDGTDFAPVTVNTSLTDAQYNSWPTDYGANGSGGELGTRWPTTGIWFPSAISTFTDVKIGSEIFLISGSSNSSIPPGTTITGKTAINYINSRVIIQGYNIVTRRFEVNGGDGTKFETSNPITIAKDDLIGFRGRLATMDNTQTGIPRNWKAVTESTGAVDPLSDESEGIIANVAVASSNSTLLQVNNMTTPNSFNPVIYPGQVVTSLLPNGSINGVVTVTNVVKTGATSANITLSSAQTLSNVDEQIRFRFANTQKWRILFDILPNVTRPTQASQRIAIYAGTDIQLPNNGNLTPIYNSAGTQVVDYAGLMGSAPTPGATAATYDPTKPEQGFLSRERRVQNGAEAYPLNYLLTLTNRGIFFGLWEGNWSAMQKTKSSTDNFFNWFLIQRPVNRYTGQVLTTGRCPIFCINSVGYKYWKFIVREEDVLHPTAGDPECTSQVYNESTGTISTVTTPYRVPADAHSQDNFAIINSSTQISLTEDSRYLISLLHDLNTPRFRYTEEMDMVGQTSADVCMSGNDLEMTAYSESGPRTYHALPANNPYNSGLRIVALKDIP
jgi:hypothetical protein